MDPDAEDDQEVVAEEGRVFDGEILAEPDDALFVVKEYFGAQLPIPGAPIPAAQRESFWGMADVEIKAEWIRSTGGSPRAHARVETG